VIVLSTILNDPLNTYLQDFKEGIVESVNGQAIKTLKDLSDAFAAKVDVYVVEFVGLGRPLVLERAAVDAPASAFVHATT
jgi:hypothetical protein